MSTWWTGHKHSEESRRKMSASRVGLRPSEETRRKMSEAHRGLKNSFYGKKHTDDTKEAISLARIGKTVGENNSNWGAKSFTAETRIKISQTRIEKKLAAGENNSNWKGGKFYPSRETAEYRKWRRQVFERDNYTCKMCGQCGGDLEAHHIKPYGRFEDLRHDVNNGATLCVICHRTTFKGSKT